MSQKLYFPGATAAADLSAKQFHIMQLVSTTERSINQASLATYEGNVGILQDNPDAAGEHASILVSGPTYIVAGAAFNANVRLTTNGSGRAIAASSGDYVVATSVEAASADGDKVQVLAQNLGYVSS